MARPHDIKGQRFGKLTAVRALTERDKSRGVRWFCRCDCGGSTIAAVRSLRSGNTKTCGCSWSDTAAVKRTRERFTRHGHAQDGKPSRTYRSWIAMWARCRGAVKYYGELGVTVCGRWRV